jgi:amino acid permease
VSQASWRSRLYVMILNADCFGNNRPVLGRRHIFMISIGGTIGMGLVLSSSKILHLAGSTGVIVAYSMMGVVVAAVMSCLAEMLSLIPEAGAIVLYPSRFIDESLGFTVGVSYW